MSRVKQKQAKKGSQKWLQLAVNKHQELLDARIAPQLEMPLPSIKWLSPLESDDYAEYRDREFLSRLRLDLNRCALEQFWPNNGPQWDGLAKTTNDQILLIEAKAHIREMQSPGSGASNPLSVKKIAHSLQETQQFLGSRKSVNWATSSYYQYANRLAHLYLFTALNSFDAYLVMLYCLNDVAMDGPQEIREWQAAIQEQDAALGLPHVHRLSRRVIPVWLDVDALSVPETMFDRCSHT